MQVIIDLKQLVHARDEEFRQLLRYMKERRECEDLEEETRADCPVGTNGTKWDGYDFV